MPEPDRWEIMLDGLGQFLAAQDANHVQILDQGPYLDVSWHLAGGSPQERLFVETELADFRRTASNPVSSSPLTLLAALGHEIDQDPIEVARISQEANGFVVTGSIQGHYLSRPYAYADLRASGVQPAVSQNRLASSQLRTGNDPAEAPAPMMAPDAHKSPIRARLEQLGQ